MSKRAWRYHPYKEPKIFEGKDLENLPVGWVDTPDKFDEAKAAILADGGSIPASDPAVTEKTDPPNPMLFAGIDAFMEAFVSASGDLPTEGRERDGALKAGIEQYMATKYKAMIDRRKSLENLREEALALDAAQAE